MKKIEIEQFILALNKLSQYETECYSDTLYSIQLRKGGKKIITCSKIFRRFTAN